mgnify:FL=1
MNFFRPAARAFVWRWREVIAGIVLVALGAIWADSVGLLRWLGIPTVLAGVILTFAGAQRARFRRGDGGPGVVQVVEGQVTYFGPLSGGTLALADLRELMLDATSKPPVWVLRVTGQTPLRIPINAENADALFDAFAQLDGIATEKMLTELGRLPDHPVVIWTKEPPRLH